MAKANTSPPLAEIRASVKRLRHEGERLVGRVQRDARSLISRGRTEFVRDARRIQQDLQGRAEEGLRALERRVIKELHAASEERVAMLEKRVASLEAQLRVNRDRAA